MILGQTQIRIIFICRNLRQKKRLRTKFEFLIFTVYRRNLALNVLKLINNDSQVQKVFQLIFRLRSLGVERAIFWPLVIHLR